MTDNYKEKKSKLLKTILQLAYLLIGICVVCAAVYLTPKLRGVTVQDILAYTPDNKILASVLIIIAYGAKSLLVVFPLLALYVAVGTLFVWPIALLVNISGIIMCCMVPYSLGRWLGSHLLADLAEKHPKLKQAVDFTADNGLMLSFGLRVIGILPGDIVSFVLGANKMPLGEYLLGSLLGLLPVMIPATILGRALQSQSDKSFILSAVCIAFIIFVLLGMYLYKKKHMKKTNP